MAARSSAHEKAARVMDLTLRGGTPGADVRLARWRQAASRTRRGSLKRATHPLRAIARHLAKPPLRTALSFPTCQHPSTSGKPLSGSVPSCRPTSPTTSGELDATPQENRERRERLAWQIRRVEKRMADVHARLTDGGA
jgi:hypothetical protein